MKDKTIVQITSELEMLGFLKANGTQCRFVSIVTDTPVKNISASCPFSGVRKISRKIGMINVDYVASVEKRIADKLGLPKGIVDYKPGKVWYTHLQTVDGRHLPVVVNKKNPNNGEYYLQYFPRSATSVYQLPDGTPIDEKQLEPWFYERKQSEFKPPVISVSLSNIKRLAASGVVMEAQDLDEAETALAAV